MPPPSALISSNPPSNTTHDSNRDVHGRSSPSPWPTPRASTPAQSVRAPPPCWPPGPASSQGLIQGGHLPGTCTAGHTTTSRRRTPHALKTRMPPNQPSFIITSLSRTDRGHVIPGPRGRPPSLPRQGGTHLASPSGIRHDRHSEATTGPSVTSTPSSFCSLGRRHPVSCCREPPASYRRVPGYNPACFSHT